VIGLSSEQAPATEPGGAVENLGKALGLLVFLAGITMIVLVFTWVRGVFDGIDEEIHSSHQTYLAQLAARQQEQQPDQAPNADQDPNSGVVVASPGAGPTLYEVAAIIALKMLGLLILGWLGALVAAKGAHLAAAYRGKTG
jgi:hypothetical protein